MTQNRVPRDGSSGGISSPMMNHPGIMLWSIGVGYEIFFDPSFSECVYAGHWAEVAWRLTVIAFFFPLLFWGVPFAVSAAIPRDQGDGQVTYMEWERKSRWVEINEKNDFDHMRIILKETLKDRDSLSGSDHLTEQDKANWDIEYTYREMYLFERLAEIDRKKLTPKPKFVSRFKNQERAERIWLVAVVLAVAGVAAYIVYFV